MTKLQKKVLLGISSGIAAYKTPEIVRLLTKSNCDVQVVLTPDADKFVSPIALQAVSGKEVRSKLFDTKAEAAMSHIELANWPDVLLIAPASANVIAKMANGFADNLLTTLALASKAKIVLAPAMNVNMWHHSSTQANLATLKARGVEILGPDFGEQACGMVGEGRMMQPLAIIAALATPKAVFNQKIVITAGPTVESIDPVRFISNHSSGKMGYALAEAFSNQGAEVVLISGPVSISPPTKVKVVNVSTAHEMLDASLSYASQADIFIGAAAVADYRVANIAKEKLKKDSISELNLELVPNPDILATVTNQLKPKFSVGFAAESENLIANAHKKLKAKKVDIIVANDISTQDSGFNSDFNKVIVCSNQGDTTIDYALKTVIAEKLVNLIKEKYYDKYPI